MALSLLLCGAVPVIIDEPVDVTNNTPDRLIVCCCCHHGAPPVQQVQQEQQTEPVQQPASRLPDVIPSFRGELPDVKSPVPSSSTSGNKREHDHDDDRIDETDDSVKISTREWRQIGHELRLIADRFQLERRPSSSRAPSGSSPAITHWIWSAVAQSAAVYIGWRLHRWATSG